MARALHGMNDGMMARALHGTSDGMMAQALHAMKLNGPMKFQSHLTDMRLGLAGPSTAPHQEPPSDPSSLMNWSAEKFHAKFTREFLANERQFASSSAATESPFLLNSLGSSCLDSLAVQQRMKMGLGFNNLGSSELNNVQNKSKGKEEASRCTSPKGTLPHWLREAVNPPGKTPEPDLPPTLSAIAQSVRVLYGERSSQIPPFVVLGPPPPKPRDPLRSLKKKKKKRSHGPVKDGEDVASTSVPQPPASSPLQEKAETTASGSPASLPEPNVVDEEEKAKEGGSSGAEEKPEGSADLEQKAAKEGSSGEPERSGESRKAPSVQADGDEEVSSEGTVSDHPDSSGEE